MLILLYKSLFLTNYPSTIFNLRGNYIMTLPIPKTTTYGLRSFFLSCRQSTELAAGLFANCQL